MIIARAMAGLYQVAYGNICMYLGKAFKLKARWFLAVFALLSHGFEM
jgi:hypothetical protein